MMATKREPEVMTREELRTLISSLGLTQDEAAERLEVNRRTLVRWLQGETPISKKHTVYIRSILKAN